MNQDNRISRRTFVSSTTASVAGSVLLTASSANRVLGANNRLRVGIIGCGNISDAYLQGAARSRLVAVKAVADKQGGGEAAAEA